MSWQKPTTSAVWQAIDAYLALAYDGPPPQVVRARLDTLRAAGPDNLLDCSTFEKQSDAEVTRYALRLGNRWFPHMKLVIERSPDGQGHLFRADTHDRHIAVAPDSREYAAFRELRENNEALAARIEAAWESGGLPTFKSYLRDDLARRRNPGSA